MSKFKVLSLFSGCGGLDLGFIGNFTYRNRIFEENNFEIIFSNDFDKDAVATYTANRKYLNGHQCVLKDIKDISDNEVSEFDIMIAGFPCQPFSNAGNRKGVHDKDGRGVLFYECERFLKQCIKSTKKKKPLAFVFENVRGILSSKMPDGTSVPEEIVRRMKKVGYNTTYKLLKASDYGVPQNRYRVIMVGTRKDLPVFNFELLDEIVQETDLPSSKGDSYDLLLGSTLCDIPSSAENVNDIWSYSPAGQNMIENIGFCSDGKKALQKFKEKIPLHSISETISTGRSWKNIDPDELPPRFKRIHDNPKKYRAPNFYRRFALGEICGTITASGQPENSGITHPFENRRFSVREIARIQSFPDDFVFPSKSISGSYKVIGNAVPPIFGWVLARGLQKHLEESLS